MELLKLESTALKVKEQVYVIQHPTEGVLLYKEWVDIDTKNVLDYILRSKGGYEIDDHVLLDEVQVFIDNLEK